MGSLCLLEMNGKWKMGKAKVFFLRDYCNV